MPTLTEFCTIVVTIDVVPIGALGTGTRIDIPVEGVATSPLWEGERPVVGIDHLTVDGRELTVEMFIVER